MPIGRSLAFSEMLTGRYDCDYVEVVGVIQRAWLSAPTRSQGHVRRRRDPRTAWCGPRSGIRPPRTRRGSSTRACSCAATSARSSVAPNSCAACRSLPAGSGTWWCSSRRRIRFHCRNGRSRRFTTTRRPAKSIVESGFAASSRRGVTAAPSRWRTSPPPTTFRYVVNVLYVKDATGDVRIETEADPVGPPATCRGRRLSGRVTPGRPMLRNAVFRVVGNGREPTPQDVTGERADAGSRRGARAHEGAAAQRAARTRSERVLVLRTGDTVFDAGARSRSGRHAHRRRSAPAVS